MPIAVVAWWLVASASPTSFMIPLSLPPATIQALVFRVALSIADMTVSRNFGRSVSSCALPVTEKMTDGISSSHFSRRKSTRPPSSSTRCSFSCRVGSSLNSRILPAPTIASNMC